MTSRHRNQHDAEFTNNFYRKLFGYALNRTILLTHRPCTESMRTELAKMTIASA